MTGEGEETKHSGVLDRENRSSWLGTFTYPGRSVEEDWHTEASGLRLVNPLWLAPPSGSHLFLQEIEGCHLPCQRRV